MDKKLSFLWSFGVGAGFTVLQILAFFLGFWSLSPNFPPISNYLFFFISGSIIGLGLIYFLRRCEMKSVFRATIIGFVIGVPFAMFGMQIGSLAGPLGSIFLSMSPGIFAIATGYFLGRMFSKKI